MESIQDILQKAEQEFKAMSWPTILDEEWRRSSPSAIPFEKLHSDFHKSRYTKLHTECKHAISLCTGLSYYKTIEKIPEHLKETLKELLLKTLSDARDAVDMWYIACLQKHLAGIVVVEEKHEDEIVLRFPFIDKNDELEDFYAGQYIVLVEEGARCNISIVIEGDGFFVPSIYMYSKKGSQLKYNFLQNTSLDSIVIHKAVLVCEERVKAKTISTQIGGMIGIDKTHAMLCGEHVDVDLNGFYYGTKDQLFDMRVYQNHISPDSKSRALYHGVAIEESHTIFRGLINVSHSAINTDAYLTNKNILLSDDARMDSIPCLTINTNEVKCSHGSTTSNLDSDHMFYLMSRGLTEREARHLVIEGFFEAVIDKIFDTENEKVFKKIKKQMEII